MADYCADMSSLAHSVELRASWLSLAAQWLALLPKREMTESEKFEVMVGDLRTGQKAPPHRISEGAHRPRSVMTRSIGLRNIPRGNALPQLVHREPRSRHAKPSLCQFYRSGRNRFLQAGISQFRVFPQKVHCNSGERNSMRR